MSLAGFKKQLNKANQFMSEKIGGAEGTKLDDGYMNTEKEVDLIARLIDEMVNCTHEYLQPNPAYRARLSTMNALNKLQGKAKNSAYPQPEGLLGDCMVKYGRDLGQNSAYGQCLTHTGESLKNIADMKYTMEDHVRDSFLHPLHSMQVHELKEINHHRKKLEGRRLDFDCKKRKQDKVTDEELKVAEEKFQESKLLTEKAMNNFLSCEIEHVQALTEFVTAQFEYHRQVTEVMEQLRNYLIDKKDECCANPRPSTDPKRVDTLSLQREHGNAVSDFNTPARNGSSLFEAKNTHKPSCRGLYDFEAENDTELAFAEGDIIRLIKQVDENWFEGEFNGRVGYFPINYVEVINPL